MLSDERYGHLTPSERLQAYHADIVTKIGGCRKLIESCYGLFEGLQDLVVSSEFIERVCLFTQNGGNGLDGGTVLKLVG